MCRKFALPALGAGLLIATGVEAGVDEWTDLGLPAGVAATAVATDPVAPATVYVATSGGFVYKSTDGGASWSGTDLHRFEDPGDVPPVLSALAIDPNDDEVVVAGADYGRIFRSHDAGVTWERDRVGQGDQVIHGLELGFGADGGAVAATSSGVWFTVALGSGDWDYDRSWGVGGSVPSGCREVHALAVDRQSPDVQYAGTDCGLYKTTTFNGFGDPLAWQQVATVPNAPVRGVLLDPFETGTLYVATDQGIRKVTGGGGTTTLISSSGLPQQSATSLAIDPLTDGLLYAGLSSQGVYKGNPAGTGAWLSFDPVLGGQGIRALAVSWPDPQRLYAVTSGGDVYGIRQSRSPAKAIDLTVSHVPSPPASIAAGGTFQASATVRNLGPAAAKNVKFVLSFEKVGGLLRPASAGPDVTVTSLQSNRGTCNRPLATCDLGRLSAGSTATITFRVQPKTALAGGKLTTVSAAYGLDVIWSAGDLNPADNQAKAVTSIRAGK
jgi:hypothetical protein